MGAWLKQYGHTLEPLCFPDTGGIEFAYSISGRGRGPVAGSTRIARLIARHDEWLKKKRTDGKPWYDIITEMLDENWRDDDDECIYDAD